MLLSCQLDVRPVNHSAASGVNLFVRVNLFFCFLIVVTGGRFANGQQVNWVNTTGSPAPKYESNSNWSGGNRPESTDIARFDGAGAYEVWWDAETELRSGSVGGVQINRGDITFLNLVPEDSVQFQIRSGAPSDFIDFSIAGSNTFLTNRGLNIRNFGGAQLVDGATLTLDGSVMPTRMSVEGVSGFNISGNLNIHENSTLETYQSFIGLQSGSSGRVNIAGPEAHWRSGFILVGIAGGHGTLNILDQALVLNSGTNIGATSGSNGAINVLGGGSQLESISDLTVGNGGDGVLNVRAGGLVTSGNGYIASNSGSTGSALVSGAGSKWINSGNLNIGGNVLLAKGGDAELKINDGGLVTVGGRTRIWSGNQVVLNGGRFEFGNISLPEYSRIEAESGSMSGSIDHRGTADLSTYAVLRPVSGVEITDVQLTNFGVLSGADDLGTSFYNKAAGELHLGLGDQVYFAGELDNLGEIVNAGGTLRFSGLGHNHVNASITGQGTFIGDAGWVNDGAIMLGGRESNFYGKLVNGANSLITIEDGSSATFHNDVTMDSFSSEIVVGSSAYAEFLGSYNGGSDGSGTLRIFGDLRPGDGIGVVNFEGDLELGTHSTTLIELGGADEFDRLMIGGDFLVDGELQIELLDGFQLTQGQEFLFAEIDGERSGYFEGLAEGGLVDRIGATDLYISYAAGDGNDIALYTIPEPSILWLVWAGIPMAFVRRRTGVNCVEEN